MEHSKLPIELVSLTLQHAIKAFGVTPKGIGKTLQLRLVSKGVNAEIERILFVDAVLDIESYRQADCLQCRRVVRAERPNKALNKATCMRYMVALFGVRMLPKWDMRIKQWTVIKQAIRELETVPGFVEKVLSADARLSKEALSVLDFVEPRGVTAERQLAVARAFADALVTLLGVRNTWANFGPHHDSCGSQAWTTPRTVNFWKMVIVCHVGDLSMVRECLSYLPFDQLAGKLKAANSGSNEYQKQVEYLSSYLAAGLTVAVRQGHEKVIDCLFEQPGAVSERVLILEKYFNKSSVLYAAANATNHSDKVIARVASHTTAKIIDHWSLFGHGAVGTAQEERVIMAITPEAPNLFKKAVKRIAGTADRELSKQLLLEVALSGDIGRAVFLLDHLPKTGQRSALRRPFRGDWSDEFGIGLDRVLNRSNIFTVAATAGQLDILKLLKDDPRALHEQLYTTQAFEKDDVASMRQWRGWDSLPRVNNNDRQRIHPVRDAINDVFIKRDRIPGRKFRKDPPAEVLRLLLEIAPEGMSWGAETVACAGLARPEYLQELLKVVKLDEWFPDKFDAVSSPLALERAKAVTIGQRALQHAVRNVKAENVKLLLEHGARLAEGVRFDAPIFSADKEKMSEMERLYEVLASHASSTADTERIAWTTEILRLGYFAPGQEKVSAEDVLAIEKDNKHFKWQVGNKSRGKGVPTAFVSKPEA